MKYSRILTLSLFLLSLPVFIFAQKTKLKEVKEYYEEDSTKLEYKYTVIDAEPYNVKHGKYYWYFDNGRVKAFNNYKNGMKDGAFITYNRWGSKRAEGTFKNDYLEGKFVNYLPGGGLDYIGYFKDGYRHGNFTYYYPGGGVKKVVKYHMGREAEPDQ